MHVERVFIDQAELHEGESDLGAGDAHIPAGLRFELLDLFGDVAPDQPGIPLDLVEGLRKDDLGLALPDMGILDHVLGSGGVLVGGGPKGRHNLVQPAPVEMDIDHSIAVVEVLVELLIGVRPAQASIPILDVAIQGDGQFIDYFSHVVLRKTPVFLKKPGTSERKAGSIY